ncbi:MAG TPA: VOC family protein [Blastocatellia bacterium]|nr:VOC family protein [Blastocatellia bacterium]
MLTGIDHVVIGVPYLDEATSSYRELGFTVVPGGRHPTGTHNALIGFDDGTYLELIAFERPSPEHRWWDWVQRWGGLTDVCLATDNLAADIEVFRTAGVKMEGPSPLSRIRPDGYRLEWKLAVPDITGAGVIPFLIEDDTRREERVPRETSHANQVTGIAGLVIVSEGREKLADFYAAVLHDVGEPVEIPGLSAVGRRFTAGPHAFDIVTSNDEAGPLARWVRERGPSIYSISLTNRLTEPGSLNPDRTSGALIQLS